MKSVPPPPQSPPLAGPAAHPRPPARGPSRTKGSLRSVALSGALVAAVLAPGCLARDSAPGASDEPDDTAEAEEAVTAGTNLALGKTATQSSLYNNDGLPAHAVDGNTSGKWTDWSVTHTQAEASPWWQVDLGSAQYVGTVELYNRTDCCSDRLTNFKLLVSDDGSAWQSWDYPGRAGARVSFGVNRSARYVKVQLNATGAADRILSLAEVKVYSPASLAQGKTAIQSTTAYGGDPQRAVDGNTDGAWGNGSVTHSDLELSPSWRVDLGSVQGVGTIELYNRTDCCSDRLSNFQLLVSDDGSSWQTWSYPGAAGAKTSFNVNRTARHIKVQLNSTGTPRILSLAEVKVYPVANASPVSSLPSQTLTATSPVGALDGQFDVDAQGGASYAIPIQVPPGTNGVEPRLALAYRSAGGNGLVGVGWALAGLSMITRCPRTVAQDGVHGAVNGDANDRFCLDGQRLMAVSGAYGADGTQYKTEVDSYRRVTSYGTCGTGPCRFEVIDRSGNKSSFGDNADAKPLLGATPRLWGLSKLTSPHGNYLTVSYTIDGGQLYPQQVLYTMNDAVPSLKKRRVAFSYEARTDMIMGNLGTPDVEMGYVGGCKVTTQKRLSSIKTFVEGSGGEVPAREYRLVYTTSLQTNRSLLASISECDGLGVCLPATQLQYGSTYSFRNDAPLYDQVKPAGWQYQDALRYDPGAVITPGDFNGDGKTDFLRQERAGWEVDPANNLWVYLSRGDGTFDIKTPVCAGANGNNCQNEMRYDAGAYLFPGDFNGDGKTDFVRQEHGGWDDDTGNSFGIYLSNGDGQFTIQPITPASVDTQFQTLLRYDPGAALIFGDYNGDGRTDFLRQDKGGWDDNNGGDVSLYTANAAGTFDVCHPSIPEAGGWDWFYDGMPQDDGAYLYPGDFNGDGMTDFMRQEHGAWDDDANETLQFFLSKGNCQFTRVTPHDYMADGYDRIQAGMRYDDGAYAILGDYNGDGKADFIRMEHGNWASDTNGSFQIYFSRGDGTFELATPTDPDLQTYMRGDLANVITMDINGDGKTDLVRQGSTAWADDVNIPFTVLVSKGDGNFDWYAPWGEWNASSPYNGSETDYVNLFTGDVDGDGKTDLLWQDKGAHDDDTTDNFRVYLAKGEDPADALKKVTTGLGRAVDVQYAPLTDSTVYTKGTGAAGSQTDVQSSMYVVKSYQVSNGPGQTVNYTYAYAGARADRDGRGFLGFSTVTATNATLGNTTTIEYDPSAFPRGGNLKSRTVKSADGLGLVKTEVAYVTSGPSSGVYTLATSREDVTHTESGQSYKTVKEYEYDAWGNVAIVHDRGLDGDASDDVDTCTIYSGDTWSWRLDYPTYTRVGQSCTIAGGVCSCTGLLDWIDRYYDWSVMNVVQVYELDDRYGRWPFVGFTYDALGNVATRSISGNSTRIVETNTYDADYGTFPVAQTKSGGALAATTTSTYDPRFGVMTSRTDENGNTSAWQLDGLGRAVMRSRTSPDGYVTPVERVVYGIDGAGPYRETDTRNDWQADDWRWQKEYLEENGRVRRVLSQGTDPNNPILIDRKYDATGEVRSETLPYYGFGTPVYQYVTHDWLGRVAQTTDAAGNVTKIAYTIDTAACAQCSIKVTTTEAFGTAKQRAWVRHNDVRGNARRQVDPDSRVTTFAYDRLERRTGVTDAAGTTTTVYDSLGRVTSVTSPDRGTLTNEYGAGDWLSSTTDANGVVTTYGYDDLGRITQKAVTGGETTTFSYDNFAFAGGLGRLTSVKVLPNGQGTPSASNDFSYTPDGAVATNVVTIDGHAYTITSSYDPQGRVRGVTYPDGTTLTRTYNAQGALSQLATGGTVHAQYGAFTAGGQPGTVTYANGTTSTLSYDSSARLSAALTAGPGNATLLSYQYTWDALHQITQISDLRDASRTQSFTYSPAGQLTQATGVYGSLSYTYDSAGNMTAKEGATYSYTNHRVTSGTGFTATYDAAGNRVTQTRGGISYQYQYGADSRLTQVSKNGVTADQYGYDFTGARVKKVDAGGTITHYVTPAFEVTYLPDGRRLDTKYVNGPSGRVAAITTEHAAGAAGLLDFQGIDSTSALFDKGSLAGLLGYLGRRASALRAHPKAPLGSGIALALAIVAAAIALARSRAPERVAALRRGLRAIFLPEKTPFMRRHRIYAWVAPVVAAAFLAACGRPPGGEVFQQTQDDLVAGANGEGYPVAGTYYFHQNHLGSSTVITDAGGNEVARAEYKPYGEIYQAASPGVDIFRSKFTGKEWDKDSELYYFNARYYDPITGRFTSADTEIQGGAPRNAASVNPYAYANNSPVIYSDPSGRFFFLVIILVAVAVGAFSGGMTTNGGSWNPTTWNWSSWQTYVGMGVGGLVGALSAGVGIGIGGFAGAMAGTLINSIAMNALKFASPEGSNASEFFSGLTMDLAIGAIMGGMMSGEADALGTTFRQRLSGFADKTALNDVVKELGKTAVKQGVAYARSVAKEHGVGKPAEQSNPDSPPPPPPRVNHSQVSSFLSGMADALFGATANEDLAGRPSRGLSGSRPRLALVPAYAGAR